jgi:hypothetical protein
MPFLVEAHPDLFALSVQDIGIPLLEAAVGMEQFLDHRLPGEDWGQVEETEDGQDRQANPGEAGYHGTEGI